MKRILFKTALSMLCVFFTLNSSAQIRALESFTSSTSNWVTPSTNASLSIADGYANCTMGLQTNSKYRGDLKFNNVVVGSGITLSSATDVYIAIKFNSTRPDGNLKFEMKRTDATGGSAGRTDGYFNTYSQYSVLGPVSCSDGGSIYYFQLTSDTAYVSQTKSAKEMQILTFIIADNSTTTSYSVDWVATFPTLADITTYKDYNDDSSSGISNTVANNTTVTASATKDGICLNNIKEKSVVTIYSVTGNRLLSTTVDAESVTIPFSSTGMFLVQVENNGKSSIIKIVK